MEQLFDKRRPRRPPALGRRARPRSFSAAAPGLQLQRCRPVTQSIYGRAVVKCPMIAAVRSAACGGAGPAPWRRAASLREAPRTISSRFLRAPSCSSSVMDDAQPVSPSEPAPAESDRLPHLPPPDRRQPSEDSTAPGARTLGWGKRPGTIGPDNALLDDPATHGYCVYSHADWSRVFESARG